MKKYSGIFLLSIIFLVACGDSGGGDSGGSSTANVAVGWSVGEVYTTFTNASTQNFNATWTVVQSGGVLTLTAVRASTGSTTAGTGSVSGSNVTVSHPCYGSGCGSCTYLFTGTVCPDNNCMSGNVIYCSEVASSRVDGTWTATRTSSARAGDSSSSGSNQQNPSP